MGFRVWALGHLGFGTLGFSAWHLGFRECGAYGKPRSYCFGLWAFRFKLQGLGFRLFRLVVQVDFQKPRSGDWPLFSLGFRARGLGFKGT